MRKKLGLGVAGVALICVFLAWMLLKGTVEVHAWLEQGPLPGVVLWVIAWLCALGGAALIARLVFRKELEQSTGVGESRHRTPGE